MRNGLRREYSTSTLIKHFVWKIGSNLTRYTTPRSITVDLGKPEIIVLFLLGLTTKKKRTFFEALKKSQKNVATKLDWGREARAHLLRKKITFFEALKNPTKFPLKNEATKLEGGGPLKK